MMIIIPVIMTVIPMPNTYDKCYTAIYSYVNKELCNSMLDLLACDRSSLTQCWDLPDCISNSSNSNHCTSVVPESFTTEAGKCKNPDLQLMQWLFRQWMARRQTLVSRALRAIPHSWSTPNTCTQHRLHQHSVQHQYGSNSTNPCNPN